MALSAGHASAFLGGTKLSRRTTRQHGCAHARQGLVVRCGESRIGKLPVTVPSNVNVDLKGQYLKCKGPKGEMEWTFPEQIAVTLDGNILTFKKKQDDRKSRQLHGLCRTLGSNMVNGVATGFEKRLLLVGVGYRAAMQGKDLVLNIGYSNPVTVTPPEGVSVAVEKNTTVVVSGCNKEIVGNFAAIVRSKRPPEPYKGKGIRYSDEKVLRKEGKSGKK